MATRFLPGLTWAEAVQLIGDQAMQALHRQKPRPDDMSLDDHESGYLTSKVYVEIEAGETRTTYELSAVYYRGDDGTTSYGFDLTWPVEGRKEGKE